MIDSAYIIFHISDLRYSRTRYLGFYYFPLCGIIIHKHKALGQQVQFRRRIGKVFALRIPVCLDHYKIIRPECGIGMLQSRDRIFMIILGIYCQEHSYIFVALNVFLKLAVYLTHARFLSDSQVFRTVIPDNSTPECIVKIKCEHLFVLAVYGFDDTGNTV